MPRRWSPSAPAPPPAASRPCATGRTWTSSSAWSTPHPDFISTLKIVHAHRRARAGGFRAARLPHQQAPVDRADRRHAGRPQAEHPDLQRLPGMQAPRQRVRRRGARSRLPGTGHASRMRRPLSQLQPRMLRLLRPHGEPQHRFPHQPVPHPGPGRRATSRAPSAASTPGPGSSARPERSANNHERTPLATPAPSKWTTSRASKAKAPSSSSSRATSVTDVKLKIFEPPRLFEAFLRGRHLSEVPDIVARICGICPDRLPDERRACHRARPGHHHRSRRPPPAAAVLLRRVDREPCAARLHAARARFSRLSRRHPHGARPSRAGGAGAAPEEDRQPHRSPCWAAARSIRFRSPSAVFTKSPPKAELQVLVDDLKWARDASLAAVRHSGRPSTFRSSSRTTNSSPLSHPRRIPVERRPAGIEQRPGYRRGRVSRSHFIEQHVKSLQCVAFPAARARLLSGGTAGALQSEFREAAGGGAAGGARVRSGRALPESVSRHRGARHRAGLRLREALRLIARIRQPPASPRVEAPVQRGRRAVRPPKRPAALLYHRYEIDDRGLIRLAKIVPPTSQNQKRIEDDLWHFVAATGRPPERRTHLASASRPCATTIRASPAPRTF